MSIPDVFIKVAPYCTLVSHFERCFCIHSQYSQILFGNQQPKSRKKSSAIYTVINSSIQQPPLLSGRSQLLALPRVIQFCLIALLSDQLSHSPEWLVYNYFRLIQSRFDTN